MPKGITGSGPKKIIPRIDITLTCAHVVPFRVEAKPSQGQPIWCSLCADYKEVA